MTNWFEDLMARDRRRTPRHEKPWIVAYFWDGGSTDPHVVRDISMAGIYLQTTQRWYPGTLVTMTLQRTDKNQQGQRTSIVVQGRVIRCAQDTVALTFVVPKTAERRRLQKYVSEGVEVADRKTLGSFLLYLLRRDVVGSLD